MAAVGVLLLLCGASLVATAAAGTVGRPGVVGCFGSAAAVFFVCAVVAL